MTLHLVGGKNKKQSNLVKDDCRKTLIEFQPDDLNWAVTKLDKWSDTALAVTTTAIIYWSTSALTTGNWKEAVKIRSLINRLQDLQPLKKQEDELKVMEQYSRWDGIVDILNLFIQQQVP